MNAPAALADAVLAASGYALVLLTTALALVVVGLGYQAGTHAAIRYQGRQLVRYCQLYLLDDHIRAALDTNYQPRKEKP